MFLLTGLNYFLLIAIYNAHANLGIVDENRVNEVSMETLTQTVLNFPYTIVLAKNETITSDEEKILIQLQNDLSSKVHLSVIKLNSSDTNIQRYYDHSNPGILFFRHTKPILFDGSLELNSIKEWVLHNLNSYVQELNEESFNLLMQSRSTTEDLFVLFCNGSDISCQTLQPMWDTVSSRFKSQKVLGFVNTDKNEELASRFYVTTKPELLLFKLEKMYRYPYTTFNIATISSFALEWYINEKAETIPQTHYLVGTFVDNIIAKIKKELDDPYAIPSIVMLSLPFSIVLAAVIAKGHNYKERYD